MTAREQKTSVQDVEMCLQPLCDDPRLRLIVLFGSVAEKKTCARSDIDIAFLFDDSVDIVNLTNQVSRLLRTDSIDVVDVRRASPLLNYSIARSGIPVYEREKGMFNEFYSLAFRRYVDTAKLRAARESYLRGRLATKGVS